MLQHRAEKGSVPHKQRFTGLFSEVEPGASGASGGIDIDVAGTLEMQGAVGITSTTFGAGDAGPLQVSAGDLLMDGQSRVVPYRGSEFVAGIASEAAPSSSGQAQ